MDGAMKDEQFCKELLPSILTLSVDKIPNVRLAVAKLLAQPLMRTGGSPTTYGLMVFECSEC